MFHVLQNYMLDLGRIFYGKKIVEILCRFMKDSMEKFYANSTIFSAYFYDHLAKY